MTGWRAVLAAAVLPVLAACGGPQPPWGTPPDALDLRVTLSATSVPLLSAVEVTLDLFAPKGLEVEFAPQVPPDGFAGKVADSPPVPLAHGVWRRSVLRLQAMRGPGRLTIPAFSARAKDGSAAATTPELELDVTSLLGQAGPGLEDPSPLLVPPVPAWVWALAAALPLVLGGLLWWWARRRRRQPVPPDGVPQPPHVRALRALARLRSEPRTTPAEVERFYVQVSCVLRVYLEERFGLHAPERTTEEFLAEIRQGSDLTEGQRQQLQRFLGQCDLVKFAAMVPDEVVHQETFAVAERFVESTRTDRRQEVFA